MIKKLEAQLNRRIQSYRPIYALYEHIEPNSLQVHQRHHYTHKLSYYYDHQSWTPHLNLDNDNEKNFANIQYQHLIEEQLTPIAKTLLEYEISVLLAIAIHFTHSRMLFR